MNCMSIIKTQLAVIGGGPAGICAALAAARSGVDTVLVTNRPVLGGNSSSEIRVWSRGAVGGGNFYSEEMGIWGELKLTNLYRNPDGNPVFWDEVLLDAVLKEEKLKLFLNTNVYDLRMDHGKIHSVLAEQQGSEMSMELQAEMYIDATGDSLLGAMAGIPYYMGSEYITSNEQGMSKEPELLGCSILFYTKVEDHPIPFVAPDYAYSLEDVEKIVDHGGRIVNEKMSGSDCWWFEYGGSRDTIKDLQEITLELKRLVMGVWNYIKNSGKFEADCYTLEWVGNIAGKRESRRMETEYILTERDILMGRTFPDGAFYGGWYMDTHPSGGVHDSGEENCVQIPVNVYQVPLSCLYHSAVPNLLFAGRNIGTQRQAFVSSRVMNTCALSGQAAGELAAAVIRHKAAPADLSPDTIEGIRLQLQRNDMFIPGSWIPDEKDVARTALVTASSYDNGMCGEPCGSFSIDGGGFVVFPGAAEQRVAMEVVAQRQSTLRGEWFVANLPNRLCPGESVGKEQWTIPEGRSLFTLTTPKECDGKFCTLAFEETEGVAIVLSDKKREGFLCGRSDSAEYHDPMLFYAKDMGFYHPQRVVEPADRPWGAPNQWRAAQEDGSPWLELHWDAPKVISQIHLFLDPALNEELPSSRAKHWQESHHFVPREQMPGQLIRDAKIRIPDGQEGWISVAQFHENYERLVKISLPEPVETSILRLEIDRTWGGAAAVYSLRVYETPV